MANIKNSPLRLLSGLMDSAAAYDWGGKRAKAEADAQGEYDKMRGKFMNLDTSNLYGDVSNPYANMENTMEDLTVNQKQAQFQAQQNQQNQANVMGSMKEAAGGSGVGVLAQSILNQGQIGAEQASASIGQQESQIDLGTAQQAGRLQQQERQGAWKADMTRRSGAEQERAAVKDKTNTLFGMSIDRLNTSKEAVAEGDAAFQAGMGDAFSITGGMF